MKIRDDFVALRPGVRVIIANEVETVLLDESRTYTFVGSTYQGLVAKTLRPASIADLVERLSFRDGALLKFALKQLEDAQLIIRTSVARRDFIYTDYVNGGQPTSTDISILYLGDPPLPKTVSTLQEGLAKLGIHVIRDEVGDNTTIPVVVLIGAAEYVSTENLQVDAPFFFVFPSLLRTLVGSVPAVSGEHRASFMQRLREVLLATQAAAPCPASWDGLRSLSLAWAAKQIGEWLAVTPHFQDQTPITSYCHRTGELGHHSLCGFKLVAPDEFRDLEPKAVAPKCDGEPLSPIVRAISNAEWKAQIDPVVDPITGVLSHVQNINAGPVTVSMTLHHDGAHQKSRLATETGFMAASGKGFSPDAAYIGCVGEAMERYCCGYVDGHEIVIAKLSDAPLINVDPRAILKFSDMQYAERDNNPPSIGFNWVPPPFKEEEKIGWVKGRELTTRTCTLLPAALVYFNYNRQGEHRYGVADSNGCASGSSLGEALVHSLLELIERDASGIWWYNRLIHDELDFNDCKDNEVLSLLRWLESQGRRVSVLDLTNDLKVPVCAAVSHDRDGGSIQLGLGASFSILEAAKRALLEMQQVGVVDLDAMPDRPLDPIQRDLVWWHRNARIHEHHYLCGARKKRVEWSGPRFPTAEAALEYLIATFKEHQLPVYALNMTRRDLPMKVVRTFVPPLRHFWCRLGAGRLYDVPVAMGWREFPLAEKDLNPVPFFL